MNKLTLSFLTLTTAAALTISAQAHDPKEHMADAEKADCAAMKDMDHSKMDMNDPVTMAMMKKCKDASHAEDQSQDGQDQSKHHDNEDARDSSADETPDL